jgi:hypothetical protein
MDIFSWFLKSGFLPYNWNKCESLSSLWGNIYREWCYTTGATSGTGTDNPFGIHTRLSVGFVLLKCLVFSTVVYISLFFSVTIIFISFVDFRLWSTSLVSSIVSYMIFRSSLNTFILKSGTKTIRSQLSSYKMYSIIIELILQIYVCKKTVLVQLIMQK